MATVFEIAKYIITKQGTMSPSRLQSLIYYSQSWSLVWDDCTLFDDDILAWASGSIVESIYNDLKGIYFIDKLIGIRFNGKGLTFEQAKTITSVLSYYGDRPAHLLSDQIRSEKPWQQTDAPSIL